MQTLQKKIETKKAQVAEAQVELQKAETDLRMRGDSKSKRLDVDFQFLPWLVDLIIHEMGL